MQQIITMMDSLVMLPDKVGGVQFCWDDISVASIEQSHTGSQELKGCFDMTRPWCANKFAQMEKSKQSSLPLTLPCVTCSPGRSECQPLITLVNKDHEHDYESWK